MREHGRSGPIEWALAGRPLPGEEVSGDHGIVLDLGDSGALFGLIDGLGHGLAAAAAAERAVAVLAENRAEPLDVLMVLSDHALADTRGAAMTLAMLYFGTSELSWLGVGNVSTCLIEATPTGPAARDTALLLGGIVGYRLPATLPSQTTKMRPGDLLLMVSDGILADHGDAIDLSKSAHVVADDILSGYAKEIDDAFVLAARHRGTKQ